MGAVVVVVAAVVSSTLKIGKSDLDGYGRVAFIRNVDGFHGVGDVLLTYLDTVLDH